MPSPSFTRISAFFHARHSLLLLVALWLLTLVGIQSIPLETHEAFVLATSQEMKTGGDWVLPRFNNEPRLKKPPVNYWATLLVSSIDPVNSDIQIYHGRIVSLLAALLMVLLTARTGEKLYGKETGMLAAVFLLCTAGSLNYSHNAKPDILYATFCTLQLFAWINAWMADTPSGQTRNALLGWAAAGLATLTKGPQVPAVFLLGLLAFLASGPDRRRVMKILHPFSGMFLFCLLVLPWWILLQHRLRALGVNVADSQLSGSLLRDLVGWKELLSLYYLWVPVVEMLPVSVLLVLFLPHLMEKRAAVKPHTRLLVFVSITTLVMFTLGGQYRKHYVLPLLPVFALFIAGNVRFIRFQGINGPWLRCLFAAGIAGAAVCVLLMVRNGAYVALFLFSGLSCLTALILRKELSVTFKKSPVFTRQLLVIAGALILLGTGYNAYRPGTQWQKTEQEFKKCVGKLLSKNDRLVCWKTSVNILPYFVKQSVRAFTDQNELTRYVAINQNSHPVFAVIPTRELSHFDVLFENRILRTAVNNKKQAKSLCLVKILNIREDHPTQIPK